MGLKKEEKPIILEYRPAAKFLVVRKFLLLIFRGKFLSRVSSKFSSRFSLLSFFTFCFFFCGFIFFGVREVNAAYSTSTYDKLFNDTLTSAEWNDLFDDFVNTWLPVKMNGPVGIGTTAAPAGGLEVNGLIRGTTMISDGEVGIGITDPSALLHVAPSSGLYSILAGAATSSAFRIGNVGDPSDEYDAANKYYVDNAISSATSSITLWGGTTGGNIWNLNSGNVGIGTTNPTNPFHVVSQTTVPFKMDSALGGPTGSVSFIMQTGGTNRWGFGQAVNTPGHNFEIYDYPGGATRFLINTTGNVGIGRTAPDNLLTLGDINLGSWGGKAISIGDTTGNATIGVGKNASTEYAAMRWNNANSNFEFYTPNKNVVFTIGTGKVGIGTTNPSDKLSLLAGGGSNLVWQGTSSGYFYIGTTKSGYWPYLGYTVKADPNVNNSYIKANGDITHLALLDIHNGDFNVALKAAYSGGTGDTFDVLANSKLIVKQSGNVGIGTTAPGARLEVVPASGYAILAGAATSSPNRIGNVEDPSDEYDAANKYYVDTLIASATSSLVTIAQYVGVTTATYNGDNNGTAGYAEAHTQCDTDHPGAHVCASFEILDTIRNSGVAPTQDAWILNGPPGYTALANDCNARTDATAAAYGTYWQKPGTGFPEGRGLLMPCNNTIRFACCQ